VPRNYKAKNKHLSDPNIPREGRISNEERKFVADNYENLTELEIAAKLQRNPETIRELIKKLIKEKISQGESSRITITHDLKSLPIFDELRQQYTKRELQTIEFHWNNLISQFKEDVYHTERMQILQYAETMVDIARIKRMERSNEELVEKLDTRLSELQETPVEDRDRRWEVKQDMAERQIVDLRNSRKSVTEEKTKLTKQANDLLHSLNATRGQRVKIATDQQMDVTSLLKAIANDDIRKKMVRENTLMQMSAEKERKRLSNEYRYMDGAYDRPILNSDTVNYEEELPLEGDYI
jgi:hypothetical protein